jgi:hypothetical protein
MQLFPLLSKGEGEQFQLLMTPVTHHIREFSGSYNSRGIMPSDGVDILIDIFFVEL